MPLLLWSFAANERMLFNIARRFARFEQYGFRMKILSPGWPDTLFRWMVGPRLVRHPDLLVAKFWLARLDRQFEPIRGWTTPDRRSESQLKICYLNAIQGRLLLTSSLITDHWQLPAFRLMDESMDRSLMLARLLAFSLKSANEDLIAVKPILHNVARRFARHSVYRAVVNINKARMIEGAGRIVALDLPSSTPIPIQWWSD
ncbi:hypothetical protein BLOT_010736 [Blomia tropicalis]|nr:hypothetical protein BLOT_010736 [Blomia tropicalis]